MYIGVFRVDAYHIFTMPHMGLRGLWLLRGLAFGLFTKHFLDQPFAFHGDGFLFLLIFLAVKINSAFNHREVGSCIYRKRARIPEHEVCIFTRLHTPHPIVEME